MSLKTIINGIDVGRQRTAAGALPAPAEMATSTEWLGGTQTRTFVAALGRVTGGTFTIDADYPNELLGSGTAPSPDELFLAALGSSFVTSFVLAAARADVRIERMRILSTRAPSVSSDLDEEVRPADVELHGQVETDAAPARLEQLVSIAMQYSPVVALCSSYVRVNLERVSGSTEP